MTEKRADGLREIMAEVAELRQRAAAARQDAAAEREVMATARKESSELIEESQRLIHIARSLRWGLALRYGAPHVANSCARWTINREHASPLTLELNMQQESPSTLWIFDPHCSGVQAIEAIKLRTDRDADDAWQLIKSHLAVA